jgi:hypothetical protein
MTGRVQSRRRPEMRFSVSAPDLDPPVGVFVTVLVSFYQIQNCGFSIGYSAMAKAPNDTRLDHIIDRRRGFRILRQRSSVQKVISACWLGAMMMCQMTYLKYAAMRIMGLERLEATRSFGNSSLLGCNRAYVWTVNGRDYYLPTPN